MTIIDRRILQTPFPWTIRTFNENGLKSLDTLIEVRQLLPVNGQIVLNAKHARHLPRSHPCETFVPFAIDDSEQHRQPLIDNDVNQIVPNGSIAGNLGERQRLVSRTHRAGITRKRVIGVDLVEG